MNLEKFTDRARGFLQAAQTIAMREGHQRLTPEHLLKALLDDEQGLAANLICAAKRLLMPAHSYHVLFGLEGQWAAVASYAVFGLASGLAGAILARGGREALARWRASSRKAP